MSIDQSFENFSKRKIFGPGHQSNPGVFRSDRKHHQSLTSSTELNFQPITIKSSALPNQYSLKFPQVDTQNDEIIFPLDNPFDVQRKIATTEKELEEALKVLIDIEKKISLSEIKLSEQNLSAQINDMKMKNQQGNDSYNGFGTSFQTQIKKLDAEIEKMTKKIVDAQTKDDAITTEIINLKNELGADSTNIEGFQLTKYFELDKLTEKIIQEACIDSAHLIQNN